MTNYADYIDVMKLMKDEIWPWHQKRVVAGRPCKQLNLSMVLYEAFVRNMEDVEVTINSETSGESARFEGLQLVWNGDEEGLSWSLS